MKRALYLHVSSVVCVLCALGYWLVSPTPSQALNSCSISRPTAVAAFSQGSQSNGAPIPLQDSDPLILLQSSSSQTSQLALGIAGSVTLHFPTPIANYAAAGLLTITRSTSTPPCSEAPVKATISGSIDGVSFTQLGTTCDNGPVSLGTFPWVSYIRITDSTDPSHPAFSDNPSSGFSLSAISGPTCLKRSLCADTATPDPALAEPTTSAAFSLGALGDDWLFADGASFQEYGNGSARLMGEIYRSSAPNQVLSLVMSFAGKIASPPAGSPLRILKPSSYIDQGGPIDPSTWYYYKTVTGALAGKNSLSAQRYTIQESIDAAQVGTGADGRSASLGAFSNFLYGSNAMLSEGSVAFRLSDCPSVLATPTPTPPSPNEEPLRNFSCNADDKTATLATLDQSLRSWLLTVSKATRIAIRGNPSRANHTFRLRSRSTTRNLVQKAWRTIWQHPWKIVVCENSPLCAARSLTPAQASIADAVRALDSIASETIAKALSRVTRTTDRKRLRSLQAQQAKASQTFSEVLQTLPVETYECSS